MTSLARRAIAEMLGTSFLVFFGASSIFMDYFAQYHNFGIAIVHGVVLSLAISMTLGVSGGHLNPAVTLGLLSIKRIAPADAFVYIASQLVGGIVAALVIRFAMPINVSHVLGFGVPTLNPTMTFGNACVLEAIGTFLLMSGVMGTCVNPRGPKLAGFGVGLTLIPGIMVLGPLTGAAFNPARAFGPAVMAGTMTSQAVWWIGPIVGAVAAALLWEHVLIHKEDRAV